MADSAMTVMRSKHGVQRGCSFVRKLVQKGNGLLPEDATHAMRFD
jgi:hypothetical protein